MKRKLSLILTCTMLIGAVPVFASEVNEETTGFETDLTFTVDEEGDITEETLEIPSDNTVYTETLTNEVYYEITDDTQPVEPYGTVVLSPIPVNVGTGSYTSPEFSLPDNTTWVKLNYYFDNQSQSTATVTLQENRGGGYANVSSFTVAPGKPYTGVYQAPKTGNVSYRIYISTEYSYPVVGTVSAACY